MKRVKEILSVLVIAVVILVLVLNINLKLSPTGNVIESQTSLATITTSYIYANGLVASYDSEGEEKFYINDHLGSGSVVLDNNGNKIEEESYYAFGEEKTSGDSRFTYAGKEKDDSGLYYYGARYYDADSGRFISPDPISGKIGNPQSLNKYAYVLNNPNKYVDPSGMQTEQRPDATSIAPNNIALDADTTGKEPERKIIPGFEFFISDYPVTKGTNYYDGEGTNLQATGIADPDAEKMDIETYCYEQECAEAAIQPWLEYQMKYFGDASLTNSNGEKLVWSEWENNPKSNGYGKDWKGFMRYIFTSTDVWGLRQNMIQIDSRDLLPGDMILEKDRGRYFHTIGIKAINFNKDGERTFSLFSRGGPNEDVRIWKSRTTDEEWIGGAHERGAVFARFPTITSVQDIRGK